MSYVSSHSVTHLWLLLRNFPSRAVGLELTPPPNADVAADPATLGVNEEQVFEIGVAGIRDCLLAPGLAGVSGVGDETVPARDPGGSRAHGGNASYRYPGGAGILSYPGLSAVGGM
jgi:hypothetical protein